MNVPLSAIVPVFLASGAVGVFGALTKRATIVGVFKPLTTILLFVVVGWPGTRLAWLVDLGIVFSLAGDVVLLIRVKKAFLIGLGLFLGAHLSYIVGFSGVAMAAAHQTGAESWSPRVWGAALFMAIATVLLLRPLWTGAQAIRAPLVGYAVALATMVVSAVAAVGAGVSAFAALGAALFYIADACLALEKFHRPIKNAPLLTLGAYWLGQLGIALAARAYA